MTKHHGQERTGSNLRPRNLGSSENRCYSIMFLPLHLYCIHNIGKLYDRRQMTTNWVLKDLENWLLQCCSSVCMRSKYVIGS